MYHSISKKENKQIHPYFQTNTLPEIFATHMKFLYENGYKVINIMNAANYVKEGIRFNEKLVVITFDDGYRDFYIEAFPVLQNYNFSATLFLPTFYIKNNRRKFEERECLNWNDVRELDKLNIHFGSHTVTHQQLKTLKYDDIEYELMKSKEEIEDNIGKPIESFSYPYAFPEENKRFMKYFKFKLINCGYKTGVTTKIGTAAQKDDVYFLRRIPANTFDDLYFFKMKMEGGYNWLNIFQLGFKNLKRII